MSAQNGQFSQGQPVKLTQAQKAAAVLVAMGKPSAARLLKFFKLDELKILIEAARRLRTVPQAELEKVIQEFEDEFTEGVGLLDSADRIDMLLSDSLPPEEINLLMGKENTQEIDGGDVWRELEKLEPARLAKILEQEHPQTVAAILSAMAPQAASRVVVTLDRALRGEVMRRLASLGQIPPAARRLIERRITETLRTEAKGGSDSEGQARVATLLNELDKETANELIRDLESAGAEDVDAIRARLFTFDDVVHLSQKARVTLLDGLSTDLVTLALRDASPEVKEAVLSALGTRSRRMIESELSMPADGVPADEVASARRRIAATALQLAQEGKLELPSTRQAA